MAEDNFDDYLNGLESSYENEKNKNHQLQTALASTQVSEQNNAVEFQLETAELLEQIEHDLRGDYITQDESGNQFWKRQEDKNLIILNEMGVTIIMGKIRKYLTKHTSLSWYDEQRIYEIMADIGDELRMSIYSKYEIMGMDTQYKKSEYVGLVLGILHSIESSYRRAIRGQTSERVNSTSIFTQSQSSGNQGFGNQQQTKKGFFGKLNPKNWL